MYFCSYVCLYVCTHARTYISTCSFMYTPYTRTLDSFAKPRRHQRSTSRCNTPANCNTLQHTATHCNTLQHTKCNTLQHTATHCKHCSALQHTSTHCNTPQHTANTLQHTATHCNTLSSYSTSANWRASQMWRVYPSKSCRTCAHTSTRAVSIPNGMHTIPSLRRARALWYTLQHTDCNTRQHTATHCNTLQHTATHCNTYQVHYNTLLKMASALVNQ